MWFLVDVLLHFYDGLKEIPEHSSKGKERELSSVDEKTVVDRFFF